MSTHLTKLVVLSQLAFGALTDRVKDRTHDRGATAVEYGLLVALIAAVIIAGVVVFGDKINSIFHDTANTIPSTPGATTSPAAG